MQEICLSTWVTDTIHVYSKLIILYISLQTSEKMLRPRRRNLLLANYRLLFGFKVYLIGDKQLATCKLQFQRINDVNIMSGNVM